MATPSDHPRPTPVPDRSPVRPAPVVGPADETAAVEGASERVAPLLAVMLVLVIVVGTTDLMLDRPTSWWSVHVAFEVGIIVLSLTCAVVLWQGWWRTARALGRTRQALAVTRRSLANRQREQEEWRRRADAERAGFGRAIAAQFAVWRLTPTESEVAFLLLQGYGHKQIAARTGRAERTVRQHAVTVYGKSDLDGRAELAAFFLHDLLPAREDH